MTNVTTVFMVYTHPGFLRGLVEAHDRRAHPDGPANLSDNIFRQGGILYKITFDIEPTWGSFSRLLSSHSTYDTRFSFSIFSHSFLRFNIDEFVQPFRNFISSRLVCKSETEKPSSLCLQLKTLSRRRRKPLACASLNARDSIEL